MRIMKHFMVTVVALLCLNVLGAVTVYKATVNGITWEYTLSNGQARIGGGGNAIPTTTSGSIMIPSSLGGYPVVAVSARGRIARPA